MNCVCCDDWLPNGFEERFPFSEERPYTIHVKRFPVEDIVPLHYAETAEILICEDLCGEIVIDNKHYLLGGHQVFVIPPYTVHSNNIVPGEGVMFVLKIHFGELERYFHAENFLKIKGVSLGQLKYCCPEYEPVRGIIHELMEKDGELMECLTRIAGLFVILSKYVDRERDLSAANTRFKTASLQELIRWTHEHYAEKITIEEVAAMAGYSKYHFCSRFKAETGMTYMNYLNRVRMSYACLMLRNGDSVQTVCRNCGFENTSHFIQVAFIISLLNF